MCSRGVLVHYLGRLGATTAVLAAELPCGDGVSTKWALERAKTLHHCDGVMSHSSRVVAILGYDSNLPLRRFLLTSEESDRTVDTAASSSR
jgi:hypothetical protein